MRPRAGLGYVSRVDARTAAWIVAVALGGAVAGTADVSPLAVASHADTISVRFDDTPLDEAVARVAAAVGAEVRGRPVDGDRHVTLSLEDVTPEEALRRLLPEQSFSLVYDRAALRTIRLHGPAQAAPPPTVPATAAAAAPSPDGQRSLIGRVQSMPAIHVDGALAQALGTEEARLPQVFGLAMREESPDLRADASRAVAHAIDTDPALRQALTQELPELTSESTLAALAAVGPRAEEFLTTLVKSTANADVRRAARTMLLGMQARRP